MPAALRSSDLSILIAAGVATVVLSVLSFVAAPVESTPPIDGSSFSAHPRGARAAYLALKQAGYRIERSFEPLTGLQRVDAATVLVLASPVAQPSQQDLRSLTQFVERGGTLLAAGRGSVPFLPGQPFRTGAAAPQAGSTATASMVSPLSRGAPEVQLGPPLLTLAPDSPYVPVYGDSARPYVIAAPFDKGRVIWWAGEAPLTNSGLTQPGHAELLVNAVGPASQRLVLWDEHYHGHTRSLWSYLAGTPLPYAGAQLAVVVVGALLAFSRRRWPIRAQPAEPRASPLEFIESIGALYERAGVAAGAVGVVRSRVRRALVTASGLPAAVSDEDLSRASAGRVSMPPEELRQLLASSARASADVDSSPDDARALVAALQQVAARLHVPARQRRERAAMPGAPTSQGDNA